MKGKGPNDWEGKWEVPIKLNSVTSEQHKVFLEDLLKKLEETKLKMVEKIYKPSPFLATIKEKENEDMPLNPVSQAGCQIQISNLQNKRSFVLTFPNGWLAMVTVPYLAAHYPQATLSAYTADGKKYEFAPGVTTKSASPEEIVIFLDMIGGK